MSFSHLNDNDNINFEIMKVLPVIEIGSHIWVGDPEQTWLEGIVLNIKGEEAEIETNDGKTVSGFNL